MTTAHDTPIPRDPRDPREVHNPLNPRDPRDPRAMDLRAADAKAAARSPGYGTKPTFKAGDIVRHPTYGECKVDGVKIATDETTHDEHLVSCVTPDCKHTFDAKVSELTLQSEYLAERRERTLARRKGREGAKKDDGTEREEDVHEDGYEEGLARLRDCNQRQLEQNTPLIIPPEPLAGQPRASYDQAKREEAHRAVLQAKREAAARVDAGEDEDDAVKVSGRRTATGPYTGSPGTGKDAGSRSAGKDTGSHGTSSRSGHMHHEDITPPATPTAPARRTAQQRQQEKVKLDNMTVDQLREMAANQKVELTSAMRKDEIIEALLDKCPPTPPSDK